MSMFLAVLAGFIYIALVSKDSHSSPTKPVTVGGSSANSAKTSSSHGSSTYYDEDEAYEYSLQYDPSDEQRISERQEERDMDCVAYEETYTYDPD